MFYVNIDSKIIYLEIISQKEIFMFHELMFVGKYNKENIQIL